MSNSIIEQPVTAISNLGLITGFHCEGSAGATYQWQSRPHNGSFTDMMKLALEIAVRSENE